MKPKAIDLFAGPGGLSLGLTASGFDIIGAIEIDKDAGRTYRHNLGDHTIVNDITKFSPAKFREHLMEKKFLKQGENLSLIAGGPPCPGFSLIGRSKISDLIKKGEYGDSKEFRHRFIDDPRNQLFREFVKYVDEFQPKYFIMENVSGMTSYQIDEDPIVDVISNSFFGYNVKWEILNASEYGVPQHRKRIIFLGQRLDCSEIFFPDPSHINNNQQIDTIDAIMDLSQVQTTIDGKVKVRETQKSGKGYLYRKKMRQWEVDSRVSNNGKKTGHFTRKVNQRDQVIFPLIKSGSPSGKKGNILLPDSTPKQIYGDIFPSQWDSLLVPLFKKAGLKAIKSDRYYVENNQGQKWLMYEQAGFKDKMRRIRWNEPSPTIVAHLSKDGYMFIHPWLDRTISVREAARIQSFPDSFEFLGSMTAQYKQVGNAVPPLLGQKIGFSVMEAIRRVP